MCNVFFSFQKRLICFFVFIRCRLRSKSIEFPEFLVILEFMKRATADSNVMKGMRTAFKAHKDREKERKSQEKGAESKGESTENVQTDFIKQLLGSDSDDEDDPAPKSPNGIYRLGLNPLLFTHFLLRLLFRILHIQFISCFFFFFNFISHFE